MKDKAPIEDYFPVTEINEIADKESGSQQHYRPIYTMHKWWARRLGSVFRSINLYSLAEEGMEATDTEKEKTSIKDFSGEKSVLSWNGDIETLWKDFYTHDIDLEGKTVLDPFMGGGTTIVEALRMNANVVGKDLNPVAWFTVKNEIQPVESEKLQEKFEDLKAEVSEEIKDRFSTNCPQCENDADAMYYFWIKQLGCRNCGTDNRLFKDYKIANSRSTNIEHKNKIICSNCKSSYSGEKCQNCGQEHNSGDYYHVHCSECGEFFESPDHKSQNTCPYCENKFTPQEGEATGTFFTCNDCGQRNRITEAIEEQGFPEMKMWGVEYYCEQCDKKGYKPVASRDIEQYEKAVATFEEEKDKLSIPHQEIPVGYNTNQILNHSYKEFKDLFTKRQLLCLGKLLNKIKEVEDQKVKEKLLAAFSDSLKYNNMLCTYYKSNNQLTKLFDYHGYYPRHSVVENSIWGTAYGEGTFKREFEKIKGANDYALKPFEKYVEDGEVKKREMEQSIEAELIDADEEFDGKKQGKLLCGDSSYLEIEDKSVDAVITDPPYFDNVMYSELADFFYVWLREALKDEYDYFHADYSPKSAEAIKNDVQGKDEEDFSEILTDIFAESRRKLKDEGVLAFTFHHKETDAWASVLESVLEAGYYVSAIYPIQAEMNTSRHLQDKGNIEYDMVIVCRKRDAEPEEGIWSELEDKIYLEAREEISKIQSSGRELSEGDIFVIAIGKCLEIYSQHYPNVVKEGENIPVKQALEFIQEIVDGQLMGGLFDELAEETDVYTATFLTYIAGKGGEISYSSLNKNLQQKTVDISELVNAGIVRKDGSKIVISDLGERAEEIQEKKEENLSAIDRAHYLAYLKEEDKLASQMHDWANEASIRTLEKLADIENSEDYSELAKFVEEKTKDQTLRG